MFGMELSGGLPALYIYLGTFISLILNGAINVPSSQIIYLTLGYLISNSTFNPYLAILLGATGNTIGNFILYKIIYSNSDFINSGLAKVLNINSEKINKYTLYFNKHGLWWLVFAKLIPTAKVFVPIIAGLSKISLTRSIFIFFAGSLLWAIMVTYLGYYFGKQVNIFQFYLIVAGVYAAVMVISYLYNQIKGHKEEVDDSVT